MNEEILRAFNNGADDRRIREANWRSALEYQSRKTDTWKQMALGYKEAAESAQRGIRRLKAKLARLQQATNDKE
jgi:hypothetical protein